MAIQASAPVKTKRTRRVKLRAEQAEAELQRLRDALRERGIELE
ncbi:MAG: hypothetical protein N2651_01310 [Fimbriimonadales bacterium]|nr:hypothetical protein [Fimbriimonadales bacterium]